MGITPCTSIHCLMLSSSATDSAALLLSIWIAPFLIQVLLRATTSTSKFLSLRALKLKTVKSATANVCRCIQKKKAKNNLVNSGKVNWEEHERGNLYNSLYIYTHHCITTRLLVCTSVSLCFT